MIDCHIIFTEETDREDWLERCVASLEHPDVTVHVHRFAKADEHCQIRRARLHRANAPERWCMFADPDDYAVEPGYSNFIDYLKTFEGNVTHPWEIVDSTGKINKWDHHLLAVRRWSIPEGIGREYKIMFSGHSVVFPEVAYHWVDVHGGNTRGGPV